VQIRFGHRYSLRESTVVSIDPEHRATGAVIAQTAAATGAASTIAIDFTHHSIARVRPPASDSDKLVSEHAGETHVTAPQLQIRLADARLQDIDDYLAWLWRWFGVIADETQFMILQLDSLHGDNSRFGHGLDQGASGV
jgi:hypothetical protein